MRPLPQLRSLQADLVESLVNEMFVEIPIAQTQVGDEYLHQLSNTVKTDQNRPHNHPTLLGSLPTLRVLFLSITIEGFYPIAQTRLKRPY